MAEEVIDRGDELPVDGAGDTADQVEEKDVSKEVEKVDTSDEHVDKDDDKTGEGDEQVDKDDEKKAKKEPTIPKSRFDQAVNKARQAEAEATARADKLEAELKAQMGTVDAQKVEDDIDKLEDDLEKAIADNNAEAKTRIRREIRAKNQQLADSRAAAHASRAAAVAIEQVRYDALVERMETEHSELNPDGDDYDEDRVAEIFDFKEAFEAKGLSSSESLRKAVAAVYRGVDKPAKKDDDDKAAEAKKKAEERKKESVEKGLDTKKKQPPSNDKAGLDSDKAGKKGTPADAAKMSDAEYDKLSEEEKKRMRGDFE